MFFGGAQHLVVKSKFYHKGILYLKYFLWYDKKKLREVSLWRSVLQNPRTCWGFWLC